MRASRESDTSASIRPTEPPATAPTGSASAVRVCRRTAAKVNSTELVMDPCDALWEGRDQFKDRGGLRLDDERLGLRSDA